MDEFFHDVITATECLRVNLLFEHDEAMDLNPEAQIHYANAIEQMTLAWNSLKLAKIAQNR